jgi:ABC-type polysaccharide transport system permease subunit
LKNTLVLQINHIFTFLEIKVMVALVLILIFQEAFLRKIQEMHFSPQNGWNFELKN